jgi:tRNA (guanine-N7-)-methyltransferase
VTRRKSDRYEFSRAANNVIERGKPLYTSIKGKWKSEYFQNNNPLVLELACGKGEYTLGLARRFPELNFIGIDIKGDRIARGSKQATDEGLPNVGFLRASIQYLDEFFDENEVSEIWLVHPDPQLRDRDEKKRLTNPYFLSLYEKYLVKDGLFHLKTDSPDLYRYSLDILSEHTHFQLVDHTSDLYTSELYALHHNIVTHYEKVFVGKGYTINYIQAINKKPALY